MPARAVANESALTRHAPHLGWYGEKWAELNCREEVQRAPGYSYVRWLGARQRLLDVAMEVADPALTVEFPTSGGGPPGM